jgi:hypothetical protein
MFNTLKASYEGATQVHLEKMIREKKYPTLSRKTLAFLLFACQVLSVAARRYTASHLNVRWTALQRFRLNQDLELTSEFERPFEQLL